MSSIIGSANPLLLAAPCLGATAIAAAWAAAQPRRRQRAADKQAQRELDRQAAEAAAERAKDEGERVRTAKDAAQQRRFEQFRQDLLEQGRERALGGLSMTPGRLRAQGAAEAERVRITHDKDVATAQHAEIEGHLNEHPLTRHRAGALWCGGIALLLMLCLLILDIELLTHWVSPVIAVPLGLCLTAAIEAIGYYLFQALGVHGGGWSPPVRIVIGGVALTALVTLMFAVVAPLAASRVNATAGENLRVAQSVAAASVGEGPDVETAGQLAVQAAQEQLDQQMVMTQGIALTAAAGSALLAWAPLAALGWLKLDRVRRRVNDCDLRLSQRDADDVELQASWQSEASGWLDDAGVSMTVLLADDQPDSASWVPPPPSDGQTGAQSGDGAAEAADEASGDRHAEPGGAIRDEATDPFNLFPFD